MGGGVKKFFFLEYYTPCLVLFILINTSFTSKNFISHA